MDLQNGAAIMKNGIKIPQIPKNKLPYNLAIPHLCIYLNKLKTLIQKDVCILTFTETLFTIAKLWNYGSNFIWPLIEERIRKM